MVSVAALSNGDDFDGKRFFNHFNDLRPIERSGQQLSVPLVLGRDLI
jgi:hypothetical protein